MLLRMHPIKNVSLTKPPETAVLLLHIPIRNHFPSYPYFNFIFHAMHNIRLWLTEAPRAAALGAAVAADRVCAPLEAVVELQSQQKQKQQPQRTRLVPHKLSGSCPRLTRGDT